MSVIKELIRTENNGTISFGNYELAEKAKLDNYEYEGDLYKIKTFHEMTKLERNGLFVYESVPGTTVENFTETEAGVEFIVADREGREIGYLSRRRELDMEIWGENDFEISLPMEEFLSSGYENGYLIFCEGT